MAASFTVFVTPGRRARPWGLARIERPAGRRLSAGGPDLDRVVRPSTSYLIRDLMRDAVVSGTGQAARLAGREVAGKTGTSSSRRDAWFVGEAGGLVTAVWVGLDGGEPLGLTGGEAAAPLWRRFVARAATGRPDYRVERPSGIVTRRVDPGTGLQVSGRKGREELFRRGAVPRRDRFWRVDRPEPVIR
jgi:penicillin-binding protein 1A